MQYTELQAKSDKELASMLAEDRAKLHALNMKKAVNQIKDVREIREIRQRISQIMTKLTALKAKD